MNKSLEAKSLLLHELSTEGGVVSQTLKLQGRVQLLRGGAGMVSAQMGASRGWTRNV